MRRVARPWHVPALHPSAASRGVAAAPGPEPAPGDAAPAPEPEAAVRENAKVPAARNVHRASFAPAFAADGTYSNHMSAPARAHASSLVGGESAGWITLAPEEAFEGERRPACSRCAYLHPRAVSPAGIVDAPVARFDLDELVNKACEQETASAGRSFDEAIAYFSKSTLQQRLARSEMLDWLGFQTL